MLKEKPKETPIVWIHDYHLMVAANTVRQVCQYQHTYYWGRRFLCEEKSYRKWSNNSFLIYRLQKKKNYPAKLASFFIFLFLNGIYSKFFLGKIKFYRQFCLSHSSMQLAKKFIILLNRYFHCYLRLNLCSGNFGLRFGWISHQRLLFKLLRLLSTKPWTKSGQVTISITNLIVFSQKALYIVCVFS